MSEHPGQPDQLPTAEQPNEQPPNGLPPADQSNEQPPNDLPSAEQPNERPPNGLPPAEQSNEQRSGDLPPDERPAGSPDAAPPTTSPTAPPTAPPARRARTSVANRVVVGLLCALLGFAVVLQVQRTASGDALASARPDDLVQILDGLQRREDDLNVEIAELQTTLGRLQRNGASSAEALAEAQRQAEALGILTGRVPATGPGVTIVIDDPDKRIPPEVLLDAIQELRNAGAEAFQVDDVRIGVDSAFTGSAGAISLDGQPLTAPYTITAIGDPPTLAAALAIPGGVLDTVRRAGGTMEVGQSDTVLVDALRPARTPVFARPAP